MSLQFVGQTKPTHTECFAVSTYLQNYRVYPRYVTDVARSKKETRMAAGWGRGEERMVGGKGEDTG